MRIPDSKIDEIRNAANIVDVISPFVQLKKVGKNFKGLCPFHQEKTPSFTVSPDKQIFHCFGCHAGGNVYKFLMDFKRISFVEAVKEVADQYGITVETEEGAPSGENDEKEKLYELNVAAARYFSDNLLKSSEGEIAREYFKKRKIKTASIKSFGLGYAPEGWDDFVYFANQNKLDLEKALELGLVDKSKDGKLYGKFRGRIIFPILSPNGRVIAFGGRILDNKIKIAKYLNSPESQIYHKRYSLYGLYHSQEEIRKLAKAILVEGYMDVISLYQNGVKNVVASSGTSLTDEQALLLSRYTKNIVVLFDADPAGQKAAMRSIEILLKKDFDVKVLSLPEGEDPDSFIQKFGRKGFEEELSKAKDFLEFQTEQMHKQGLLTDPTKMTESIRTLVETISFVDDELKRNLLIKNISRKFNLREKLIESELEKFLSKADKKKRYSAPPTPDFSLEENLAAAPAKRSNKEIPVEKEIIKLLLSGEEKILGYIFDNILPEEFIDGNYSKISSIILAAFKKDILAPAAIIETVDDEELRNIIMTISFSEEPISKRWETLTNDRTIETDLEKLTIDVVYKFRVKKLEEQIRRTYQKMQSGGGEEDQKELLKEIYKMQIEKKNMAHSKPSNGIN